MTTAPAFIIELAETFRRIKGSVRDGELQTVWHQGRSGAELMSWQDEGGRVQQQELSFFGQMVLWKRGKQLETAKIPTAVETTHAGRSKAEVINRDTQPAARTLKHAAFLLEAIQPRDELLDHMLQQIRAVTPGP